MFDVDSRRQSRKSIGEKYEIYMAKATSDRMALNAVLLPMLISERRHTHMATSTSAFSGNLRPGCIRATVLENSSPLSREKAHDSREVEAKQLKKHTMTRTASMATKTFVAAFDPVAWYYTWRIGSGSARARSMSPIANSTVIM